MSSDGILSTRLVKISLSTVIQLPSFCNVSGNHYLSDTFRWTIKNLRENSLFFRQTKFTRGIDGLGISVRGRLTPLHQQLVPEWIISYSVDAMLIFLHI